MRQREIDKLNRESEKLWRSKYDQMPAKVGTVPMTIWVSHDLAQLFMGGKLHPDTKVEFYEAEYGQKQTGLVIKTTPILFMDRF